MNSWYVFFQGSQWVSFDDTTMVRHKTQYIKKQKLGGAMIWALDLDDFRFEPTTLRYLNFNSDL
jgi:GH18 family chitinase